MSQSTCVYVKGRVSFNELLLYLEGICTIEKSSKENLETARYYKSENLNKDMSTSGYTNGFINVNYRGTPIRIFYLYDKLNTEENVEYYKKHGLIDMVKSKKTYLSFPCSPLSVELGKNIIYHFGSGWIDDNDCDEESYYFIENPNHKEETKLKNMDGEVIIAIRIFSIDMNTYAHLKFSISPEIIVINWLNTAERTHYLKYMNGYTIIYDERNKGIFSNYFSTNNISKTFTWNDKMDQTIDDNGVVIAVLAGSSKRIQQFVEDLSYKINGKVDWGYIGGRAAICTLPENVDNARKYILTTDYMNQFVAEYTEDDAGLEILQI